MRSVAAIVGEHVAAFELGILSQVFGLDRSDDGLPTYEFSLCGIRPGRRPTTSGWDVHVTHTLATAATADVVAVPAWPALDAPLDRAIARVLRDAVDRGARVLSVCTGAFALAGAGVLDGRRATTHWQFCDRFAGSFPRVRLAPDVLYVEDGPVLTSAGAAAGLDACLHLVRRAHGTATANALARRMVLPAHRSGGQAQYIESPLASERRVGDLAPVLDWIVDNLDRPLTVDEMASEALMSPRTFARRFRATTGTTPNSWLLEQRLARAESLLERTDLRVDEIASRSGFGAADTLRHHFVRRRQVPPSAYRASFRRRIRADA
jgi:transcriptional regulator GlxA family with amidase domain